MSTAFQAVYKNKKSTFWIKLYKLTSSNVIKLFFLVNSRKEIFHNGNKNSDMSIPQRTSFYQLKLQHKWMFSNLSLQWWNTSLQNCSNNSLILLQRNCKWKSGVIDRIIACRYCSIKDKADSKGTLYVFNLSQTCFGWNR